MSKVTFACLPTAVFMWFLVGGLRTVLTITKLDREASAVWADPRGSLPSKAEEGSSGAVPAAGSIEAAQADALATVRRAEAAHQNALEGLILFFGGVTFALLAGVPVRKTPRVLARRPCEAHCPSGPQHRHQQPHLRDQPLLLRYRLPDADARKAARWRPCAHCAGSRASDRFSTSSSTPPSTARTHSTEQAGWDKNEACKRRASLDSVSHAAKLQDMTTHASSGPARCPSRPVRRRPGPLVRP